MLTFPVPFILTIEEIITDSPGERLRLGSPGRALLQDPSLDGGELTTNTSFWQLHSPCLPVARPAALARSWAVSPCQEMLPGAAGRVSVCAAEPLSEPRQRPVWSVCAGRWGNTSREQKRGLGGTASVLLPPRTECLPWDTCKPHVLCVLFLLDSLCPAPKQTGDTRREPGDARRPARRL